MGPVGFKNLDKRHYHVKDVADVIEWFAYRASRDEQALKVIKTLRNSHNTQSSMIRSYQMRDANAAKMEVASSETPLRANQPGKLEEVEAVSKAAQDEALLSELKEVVAAEKAEAVAAEEQELTSEDGDVDTSGYSVFYIKGNPRFKKGNLMVKAVDVPEAVRAKLTAEKTVGES